MTHDAGFEPSLLDPIDEPGWERVRATGHRMVDDLVARLSSIRDTPVWRPLPDEARAALRAPFPESPGDLDEVYDRVRDHVLPFGPGGIHPRFWGWVTGTGTATGALAEMLAATLNGPAGLFNDVTGEVEGAVLDWCKRVVGFPAEASGTITSGGSVANLIGLQIAREAAFPGVRQKGLRAFGGAPVVYASDQIHSSIHKAVAALGFGWDALRLVPSDDRYRLPVEALARVVERDRSEGMVPVAVVASAGTVNTGAVDPLTEIAHFCRTERVWLHVDGAVGALARMAPSVADVLDGMAMADSVGFDFHKWLYVPYEAGCVLVRDETLHRATYSVPAAYLSSIPRGVGGASLRAGDLGPQLSRGFKALKIWMSLHEAGVARYREAMERNIALARELEQLVAADPELELMSRTDLSIVCFRFRGRALDAERQDAVNREILMRLQEDGVAVPSHTVLRDRFTLRCAIVNHRTTSADLRLLVDHVCSLGRTLSGTDRLAGV